MEYVVMENGIERTYHIKPNIVDNYDTIEALENFVNDFDRVFGFIDQYVMESFVNSIDEVVMEQQSYDETRRKWEQARKEREDGERKRAQEHLKKRVKFEFKIMAEKFVVWLEKLRDGFVVMWKKLYQTLLAHFSKSAKFVEDNKESLKRKAQTVKGFKYKGHKFELKKPNMMMDTDLKNLVPDAIKSMTEIFNKRDDAQTIGLHSKTQQMWDVWRTTKQNETYAKVLGISKGKNVAETLRNYYKESMGEKVVIDDFKNHNVNEMIDVVLSYKNELSELDSTIKEVDGALYFQTQQWNQFIKLFRKIETGEFGKAYVTGNINAREAGFAIIFNRITTMTRNINRDLCDMHLQAFKAYKLILTTRFNEFGAVLRKLNAVGEDVKEESKDNNTNHSNNVKLLTTSESLSFDGIF